MRTIHRSAGSPAMSASPIAAPADPQAHTFGSFGANENGLLDLGGNVWEWTSTCFVRTVLDDAGSALSKNPNCGVRVARGQAPLLRHRLLIRDARAGAAPSGRHRAISDSGWSASSRA